MMSSASTVRDFLVEREPLISGWISDVLAKRGVQVRVLPKVLDVMRAARSAEPHAVIVDLASIAEAHEPHLRMGPDHVMSVLRQAYPRLCIVALVSTYNTQMQALSQDFGFVFISSMTSGVCASGSTIRERCRTNVSKSGL
jgi:hypothetical protein